MTARDSRVEKYYRHHSEKADSTAARQKQLQRRQVESSPEDGDNESPGGAAGMKISTSEEEQKILISDFQYRKGLKEQSDFPDDSHSTMSTRSSSRGGSSQTHAILGGASLQTSGAGSMILQGDAGAAGSLHRTGVRTGASEASSSSASGSSRDKYSSKVSNFAIQYNLGCATLAIAIMQTRGDVIVDPTVTAPDFPVLTKTEKTLALAMIFLGNIVGMLVMGYLGDLLGVARALCVTTAVSIAGQVSDYCKYDPSHSHLPLLFGLRMLTQIAFALMRRTVECGV